MSPLRWEKAILLAAINAVTGITAANSQVMVCPTSNYKPIPPISGNERCNPGQRESKACDTSYEASSKPWQACYKVINDCRKDVDAENSRNKEQNTKYLGCKTPSPEAPKAAAKPLTKAQQNIQELRKQAANADEKNKKALSNAANDSIKKNTEIMTEYKQRLDRERREAELAEQRKLDEDLVQQRARKAQIRREIERDQNSGSGFGSDVCDNPRHEADRIYCEDRRKGNYR